MKPRCMGPFRCDICDGEHQCDLAVAQQKKLEEDRLRAERKPTLKTSFANLAARTLFAPTSKVK